MFKMGSVIGSSRVVPGGPVSSLFGSSVGLSLRLRNGAPQTDCSHRSLRSLPQRVQSTDIVECRVSILGITIMT